MTSLFIKISVLFYLSLNFFGLKCMALTNYNTQSIVEENNLWIGPEVRLNDMTKEKFDEIINTIEKIYKPIFERKGKTLEVIRDWDSGTVNAYAQQEGDIWKVKMFGGLARHETITFDAFAMVMCHELGHHVAGAPKKSWGTYITWASNEGQSDIWGAQKCMRRYLQSKKDKDNNDNSDDSQNQPQLTSYVTEKCEAVYVDVPFNRELAVNECEQISLAGKSLGNLFVALSWDKNPIDFETPDGNIVEETNHNHPAAQCRLDSYFQGALCNLSYDKLVDDKDPNIGMCNRYDEFVNGLRPLCWYKPMPSKEGGDDNGEDDENNDLKRKVTISL